MWRIFVLIPFQLYWSDGRHVRLEGLIRNMLEKLTTEQINIALEQTNDWCLEGNTITRHLKFRDFNQAFGVMTRIALVAEKWGHHPEWRNVYNQLDIALSTHDVGGLSELDFRMAKAINHIVLEALSLES